MCVCRSVGARLKPPRLGRIMRQGPRKWAVHCSAGVVAVCPSPAVVLWCCCVQHLCATAPCPHPRHSPCRYPGEEHLGPGFAAVLDLVLARSNDGLSTQPTAAHGLVQLFRPAFHVGEGGSGTRNYSNHLSPCVESAFRFVPPEEEQRHRDAVAAWVANNPQGPLPPPPQPLMDVPPEEWQRHMDAVAAWAANGPQAPLPPPPRPLMSAFYPEDHRSIEVDWANVYQDLAVMLLANIRVGPGGKLHLHPLHRHPAHCLHTSTQLRSMLLAAPACNARPAATLLHTLPITPTQTMVGAGLVKRIQAYVRHWTSARDMAVMGGDEKQLMRAVNLGIWPAPVLVSVSLVEPAPAPARLRTPGRRMHCRTC